MSRDKVIAAIGLSEQEEAHLRLVMRRCAADLAARWQWGAEDKADLVVVDLGSFAAQMARTRAQAAGVRCAVFADAPVADADLVLQRPLKAANLIELLNEAARSTGRDGRIEPQSADFYTRDIGDLTWDWAAHAAHAQPAASGLDEMLRPAPVELRGTGTEPPPRPSAPAPKAYATREQMLADTRPQPLRAYLAEDVLGRPARIALPDLPPLVLDPKLKVYHAAAGLAALEPYCRAGLRPCDWRTVTGGELAELRTSQPAQPYLRLVWLDAFVHSQGRLAPHLDPGGSYRLARWMEGDERLARQFRIATAMLQPARLHEIAAASGASMAEVFDVVNAFDAAGMLERQPRPRRDEEPGPGFFGRLRRRPSGR